MQLIALFFAALAALTTALAGEAGRPATASGEASAIPAARAAGQLIVQEVHGSSLEESVTGEDPKRAVAVYLPPSYKASPGNRYPVLFLLHGIGGTHQDWTRSDAQDPWGKLEGLMNRGIAAGRLQEMIVVMPDQMTKAAGSFYTNSDVTGHWEDFTVRDLVRWVDGEFRTLARSESRGIAGHSMGGYGSIMLGMKHPDVFSVVYAMSPALLGWGGDLSPRNPVFRTLLSRRDWDDLETRWESGVICVAQAFSPNPGRPPFYIDLPFKLKDGKLFPNEEAFAAWEAHFPVLLAPRYRANLLKLRGLRFDSGSEDEFTHIPLTSREFSKVLTKIAVPHIFEEYNGDHRNRLWGRTGRLYTEVLPWFSLLLEPEA